MFTVQLISILQGGNNHFYAVGFYANKKETDFGCQLGEICVMIFIISIIPSKGKGAALIKKCIKVPKGTGLKWSSHENHVHTKMVVLHVMLILWKKLIIIVSPHKFIHQDWISTITNTSVLMLGSLNPKLQFNSPIRLDIHEFGRDISWFWHYKVLKQTLIASIHKYSDNGKLLWLHSKIITWAENQ